MEATGGDHQKGPREKMEKNVIPDGIYGPGEDLASPDPHFCAGK
jgi:hypothetical protein